MASSIWQVGAGLAAVAGVYPLTRKYDKLYGVESRKRKLDQIDEGFHEPEVKRPRMAFRIRRPVFRRRRRRLRVRKKRFVRRKRARNFAKRVRRVIRRTAEPKKNDNIFFQENSLFEGSTVGMTTARVTYIMAPMLGLVRGTQKNQYIGSQYFLRGYNFRGQIGISNDSTDVTGFCLRVTCLWSREIMDHASTNIGNQFATFDQTTSASTTPTEVVPFANPRIFETTGPPGYHGEGYTIPFDRTNNKVIGSRMIWVNPGSVSLAGNEGNSTPTLFNIWFPINRTITVVDPTESTAGSTITKHGVYYIIMQLINQAGVVNDGVKADISMRVTTYFRDP